MSLINRYEGKINVIGENLRKYRMEQGLSYEKLSAKLELLGIIIHKQSLYDVEKNKRVVKDYELYAIARVLKIPIDKLFEGVKME